MKKIASFILMTQFIVSLSQTVWANEAQQKQLTLYIKEMTCQLCAYLVNTELRNVEGVISTKATIKDRLVKIVAQPSVTDEQLFQAIKKLKYTAEVVTNQME